MSAKYKLASVRQERAYRHLRDFVRYMWPVIEPGTDLQWGWPYDAICDHLEAITWGHLRDLLISVPPRSLKSTIVSVMWPAWEWLHRPELRYLTSSYHMALAIRDALRTRRVITSELYQELNRDSSGNQRFVLTGDQNQKQRYENNLSGHRICTSPDSGTTGEGGDRVMGDDILSAMDSQSELKRDHVWDWWCLAMSTRRNDPKTAARVMVGQRLHEDDPSGRWLKTGVPDHLCLPLLYEQDHPTPSRTALSFVDPRSDDGEILFPDRMGEKEIQASKDDLGTYGFLGQQQQRPSAAQGNIILRSWFRRYSVLPALNEASRVLTSWDCTFGAGEGNGRVVKPLAERSWVVGQVWAFFGARSYLVDEVRGRWTFVQTLQQMLSVRVRWPMATGHIVENKANGPAIEATLQDTVPGIVLMNPSGSKVQRLVSISPIVESGNVYLPTREIAPWIDEYIDELATFPRGKADDRVDTTSQVLIFEHVTGVGAALRALEKMVG